MIIKNIRFHTTSQMVSIADVSKYSIDIKGTGNLCSIHGLNMPKFSEFKHDIMIGRESTLNDLSRIGVIGKIGIPIHIPSFYAIIEFVNNGEQVICCHKVINSSDGSHYIFCTKLNEFGMHAEQYILFVRHGVIRGIILKRSLTDAQKFVCFNMPNKPLCFDFLSKFPRIDKIEIIADKPTNVVSVSDNIKLIVVVGNVCFSYAVVAKCCIVKH